MFERRVKKIQRKNRRDRRVCSTRDFVPGTVILNTKGERGYFTDIFSDTALYCFGFKVVNKQPYAICCYRSDEEQARFLIPRQYIN